MTSLSVTQFETRRRLLDDERELLLARRRRRLLGAVRGVAAPA